MTSIESAPGTSGLGGLAENNLLKAKQPSDGTALNAEETRDPNAAQKAGADQLEISNPLPSTAIAVA